MVTALADGLAAGVLERRQDEIERERLVIRNEKIVVKPMCDRAMLALRRGLERRIKQ